MKFLQKHKNKIFALCLAAVLLSCFMGFSFSSSAANITQTVSFDRYDFYLRRYDDITGSWSYSTFDNFDGVYQINASESFAPGFNYNAIEIDCFKTFSVEAPSGQGVSFGLIMNLLVLHDGSVSGAESNGLDVLDAVIWNKSYLRIYSSLSSQPRVYRPYSYILRDIHSHEIIEVSDEFYSYWEAFGSSGTDLEIVALYDFSDLIGSTVTQVDIFFPADFSAGFKPIFSEPGVLLYTIADVDISYNLIYRPFNDVVQDDLSDIKDSLGGVNGKLDSISSSVNTIYDDVHSVDQTVSDLRDDLTQGDPDIESSNSDLQDQITDAKDEIGVIDSEINSVVSDILDRYPDAENPFDAPDVPILSDIWASQFINELWDFFKAQSIFFTFIHTGLLFCLVSFILRR